MKTEDGIKHMVI